jgi:hypothetical protein
MGEKLKKFLESLQITLKNVLASSQKVLDDLDKADKKIEKDMGLLSGSEKSLD